MQKNFRPLNQYFYHKLTDFDCGRSVLSRIVFVSDVDVNVQPETIRLRLKNTPYYNKIGVFGTVFLFHFCFDSHLS